MALLKHCGETYLPFLAANTRALQDGAGEVAVDIQGRPYSPGAVPLPGEVPRRAAQEARGARHRTSAGGSIRFWSKPAA